MDDRPTSPATQERSVNTTLHLSNGASLRRSSSSRPSATASDASSVLSSHAYNFHQYTTLTIIKDSKGYGMKVSGDNPVYVQSVKDGGAAEKAGLHNGDKIIKVNGIDVTHSTHTEVVELIKSSVEVELTVQQRMAHSTRPPMSSQVALSSGPLNRCSSPSSTPLSPNSPTNTASITSAANSPWPAVQRPLQHHHSAPARDRITAPQPVDHEKLRQFESQRVQTFRLMLEKEQRYADALRSELAKCTDSSNEQQISRDLSGAKRRISTIQEQLQAMTANNNCTSSAQVANNGLLDSQLFSTPPPPPPLSTLPTRINQHTPSSSSPSPSPSNSLFSNSSYNAADSPPPLPLRNRSVTSPVLGTPTGGVSPPPLPPRQYPLSPMGTIDSHPDTLLNASSATIEWGFTGSPLPVHHQRTKSNPDRINDAIISLPAGAKGGERLSSSESLSDLNSVRLSKSGISWKVESPFVCTPPGTPPPPYHGDKPHQKENLNPSPPVPPPPDDVRDGHREEDNVSHDVFSPNNTSGAENVCSQTTIISMEDDDMFDQDTSHLKDHGPFKSLSKLWKHNAHLAVFLNYVLSNCDPSSILFYLITDLYKEGNCKEMRKWAYEIHSSFLVPGAPLRLNKADENIAREIDDVLLNESDKEEILRKVFWKARLKAKEELNDQLTDFQQKRGAGLGAIFGATDTILDECIHDKNKELITVEQILVPRLKEFINEDTEKEVVDDRKFTTAAALGTILSKIFGLRGQSFNSLLERCPTFVSKEKSFKARLIGRSRKVNVRGHNFIAHQYFTITYCNHCQLIIRGIGPQGYQCTHCLLNIHRPCVKILEENCPGPVMKKEKTNDRITKFMDRIRPERKPSTPFSQIERIRRGEEQEGSITDNEIGEKSSNIKSNNRSGSIANNFVDSLREAEERTTNKQLSQSENNFFHDFDHVRNPSQRCKSSSTSINRSESYKERIHQKKQRERRKTSDPNLSKTNADVEIDNNAPFPYPSTNSGSSSNSNLSSSSLDSPSNSLEVVGSNNRGSCENTPSVPFNYSSNANNVANKSSIWDSESDTEPDPPELFKNLSQTEKKRQEVINELFQTERSHIRVLRVLDQLFYQPMKDQQILPTDYLQLLFPNLEEIFLIHSQLNSNLKSLKKENAIIGDVGDLLLKTFDGVDGKNFENAAAVFCCRQKVALEMFKEKRSKKDSPLHTFLKEAESHPMCRRLQLQDIIPTEMQRLTKYPLLFENLAKYSKNNPKEEKSLFRAIERSKEIVNRIDEAIKEAADEDLMADIQKRLDKSAFDKIEHPLGAEVKNLDLTKRKLVHQGNLNLRITNKQKLIELYVLLLEDLIILLQKSHEKYLLQFFPSGSPNERGMCPVIKVSSNIIVRRNAVDKKALYLLDQAPYNNQMYDFVAQSAHESKEWLDRLSNAADAHKSKDAKHKHDRSSEVSTVSANDLETCENASESPAKTKDDENCNLSESSPVPVNARHPYDESSPSTGESATKKSSGGGSDGASPGARKKQILSAEPPRLTTEVPLIEPSQVLVSQRSVLTAEPVLTPLERLRRKDEVIKEALLEKQKLVADILHVPKGEFDSTQDFASEAVYDKEASELVLAAVNRVDHLTSILNECLRVTEEDVIAASCEVNATSKSSSSAGGVGGGAGAGAGAGGSGNSVRIIPAVPVPRLQSITHSLSAHLVQLLTLVTERDEEREKLRQELQRSREKLHAVYEMQQLAQCLDDQSTAPAPSPSQVVENSSNDNQPDENKNVQTNSTLETDNSS